MKPVPQRPLVLLPPLGALAQQLTLEGRTALERTLGKGTAATAPCVGVADQLLWAATGRLAPAPMAQAVAAMHQLDPPLARTCVWLQPVVMATGMSDVTIQASVTGCTMGDAYAAELTECAASMGIRLHRLRGDGFLAASDTPDAVSFTAPDMAMEQSLLSAMPAGPGARPWHRLINESQVLARHHAMQTFNSLWPWGPGAVPALGDEPLANGMAIEPALAAMLQLLPVSDLPVTVHCLAGTGGRLLVQEHALVEAVTTARQQRGRVIFADGPEVRFDRMSWWRRQPMPLIHLRSYRHQ